MTGEQKTIELMTKGDLNRYRAAIIEECARVAEGHVHPAMDIDVAARYRQVAAAIRALKD